MRSDPLMAQLVQDVSAIKETLGRMDERQIAAINQIKAIGQKIDSLNGQVQDNAKRTTSLEMIAFSGKVLGRMWAWMFSGVVAVAGIAVAGVALVTR